MIHKIGQIMLYVNNQDEAVNFWTEKVGFHVISEENNGQGMRWIEIGPTKEAETTILLHNKEFVAKMSPGLNLGTPSLMFFSENLDTLHSDLLNKKVTVGDIVNMPSGRVFNFADSEENYFAVMEKVNN
ncbi:MULTISPECIES: VOC family protein [Bacillaceae]|uniref:VOC family protein n=1 Tax=Bacillaceae TaxID=186817 RepID=UPI000E70BF96|nr:VOC family protein [Bacillus sp. PK3_68]RJS58944.1 glyoxalase/bleomycin resistance/extradiol dioxygenase family protein [Bacillus sp. PK3_68]